MPAHGAVENRPIIYKHVLSKVVHLKTMNTLFSFDFQDRGVPE